MGKYTEADKGRIASIFQTDYAHCKGVGFTKSQAKRALAKVWDDDNFWFQCAERQGLFDKPISEVDKFAIEHAAGNFWAMLREASCRR